MTRPKFNFSGLFSRVLQYFTLASIISLTLQPWQAAFTKPVAPQSAASSSDMNPFEETGEDSDLMNKWNEDIYAPSAPSRPAQPLNNQTAPTPPKPSVYMKRPTLVPTDEPVKPAKPPVSLPLPTDNAPLMQKRIQHENTIPAPAAAPAQAKPNVAPAKTRKAPKETEKEKPTTPSPEQPIPQKGQNNRPTTEKYPEIRTDQPKIEHQAPAAAKPDAPKPMDIQKIKPSETKPAPEAQPAQPIAPRQTEKTAKPAKLHQSEQPKQAAPKPERETKRPAHPESTSVQEKPGVQPEGTQSAQTLSSHQKEKPAKKRKTRHKPNPADTPVIEAKPLPVEEAGKVPANQPPEKKAAEQAKSGQTEKSQPKPPKPEKTKKLKPVKVQKPVAESKAAQPAQTETPITPKSKPAKPVRLPKPKKDKPFKLPQEPVELMPFPNTDGKRQPEESQPAVKPDAFAKPASETLQLPQKEKPKKEKIRKAKPPRPAKVKTEPVKPASEPKPEKPLGQPAEAMPADRVPVKAVPAEAKPKKERKAKRENPVQHPLTPIKQPPAKTQTEKPAEPLAMPVEAKQEAKPAEIKKKAPKAPRPKHRAEEKQREQHLSEPGANPQTAAPQAEPETKKQAQPPKQDRHQDMGQKTQKADTPEAKPEKRHRKKDKPPKQKLNEAQSKTAQPDAKGLPTPVNGNPDNEKRTGKAPSGMQETQPNDQGKSNTPQKGRKKADKKAKNIPTDRQGSNTPASHPTVAQPPVSQGANKPNGAIQPVIPAEKRHKPPRHKKEKPAKQIDAKAKPVENAIEKTTPKGKPAQTEAEKTATPLKLQTDSQGDVKKETKKPDPTVKPQANQEVNRRDKKRKAKKQKQEKQSKAAPQPQQPVSAKTPEAEKKAPDQSVRHEKPRHKQKPAKPTQAEQDGNKAQTTHTDDVAKPFPNPKLGQPDGTAADAFPETEKPRKSKAEKRKQRAEQVKAPETPKPKSLHAEPTSARPEGVSEPIAKTTEPGTPTPPEKSGKPAKKEKKHKTPQGKAKQDAPKTPSQETTKDVQKTVAPSRPDAATPATGAQPTDEKPPVSPATPDEAKNQAPATSSLQTRTPASAPAPVSKSIQDLTAGLSPELATQFASAQDKAIAYEALLNQRQHAPKPASFEPVLAKGQEAAAEILRILEYLDDTSVEALSRHMPGYLLLRDEVIVVAPDPAYFREQSKKYGTPTDVTFFDLMSQTLNGYWPVTMEQLTDLSGCTRFGAHDLVKLYGGWQTFRKQHPNAYQTTLKDPNMMLLSDIEDQLLHSQAACDGPDSVVDELQTFIKTYPHSDLTPKLQARLTAIQKKQEADMVYFQGVQHTLK